MLDYHPFVAVSAPVRCCQRRMCRAGANRSVSASRILSEVLNSVGYVVGNPTYLCQNTWRKRGICNSCEKCEHTDVKAKLYEDAIYMWHHEDHVMHRFFKPNDSP